MDRPAWAEIGDFCWFLRVKKKKKKTKRKAVSECYEHPQQFPLKQQSRLQQSPEGCKCKWVEGYRVVVPRSGLWVCVCSTAGEPCRSSAHVWKTFSLETFSMIHTRGTKVGVLRQLKSLFFSRGVKCSNISSFFLSLSFSTPFSGKQSSWVPSDH